MKAYHIILPLLTLASVKAQAQVNIDFESNKGYKALGVYDVWEESPFRTGTLQGNWAITPNPDTAVDEIIGEAPNGSAKVLGAQRSRFGSNRMGVRIDLEETFELTPTPRYVHVMLNKPTDGRVMLVGLGSRNERLDQDPYCEQFWTLSSCAVEPGKWSDAVFLIKGVPGISIRSFVVVPDCESPHNLMSDFLFYIDNIEVNTSSSPRVSYEYYTVTGTKASSPMTRNDRHTTAINLTAGDETQTLPVDQVNNDKLYQDLTDRTFWVQKGQTIAPEITFAGSWMHSYCYIDLNNNGTFDDNELMSYNAYNDGNGFKNSKGESLSNGNPGNGKMPEFKLPDNLAPGRYRMRYKLDWNSLDPAGNPGDAEGKNLINDNGGVVADVILNVAGETVEVNDFQLNGEVLAADGSKLSPYKAPYGKPFTIKMNPEKGFHHGGVDIKVGFNLTGDPVDKFGNPQYNELTVSRNMFEDDIHYTIPGENMRGNLLINGRMVEDGADEPEDIYPINFPEDLSITRNDRHLNTVTLKTSGSDPDKTISINSKNVYQYHTDVELDVMPGETITPEINYSGNAMHNYWYVDWDADGAFNPDTETVSYSYADGKNSLGQSIDRPESVSPNTSHPFTVPEKTVAGLYRCRVKIDWNNNDPGGQYGQGSNDIHDNGGYVIDFYLHVHGATANVKQDSNDQAGNLMVETTVPHGQALKVSATSDKGNKTLGLNVKYGYRLSSKATFLGHDHWQTAELTPAADGFFTIPAEMVRGTVQLSPVFDPAAIVTVTTDPGEETIYNISGIRLCKPTHGVNIINGKKIYVK